MKTVKDFSDLVKIEMEERKLKPQQLADIAGVSYSCVYGLVNMSNRPTTDNLCKILWAVGYDIALISLKDRRIRK